MAEIQIRISEEKKKQFKELCDKNKDTMADVIKKAIDEYIKNNLKVM
jgi:predicted DNA-binding protein